MLRLDRRKPKDEPNIRPFASDCIESYEGFKGLGFRAYGVGLYPTDLRYFLQFGPSYHIETPSHALRPK